LESGTAGPVIIGHADQADVLRLQAFLPATASRSTARRRWRFLRQTLIERFHVDPHQSAHRALPER